ncbi:MAG: AAA family ATPase [bacterium]|nr:AAA family ATPase [bacterium]
MPLRLSVAGKGGTGKTTVVALIIRALRERGEGAVLAIDADPNSNLHEALGLTVEATVADILAETKTPGPPPAGMTKNLLVEYRLRSILVESPRLDLLSMGTPEGPGCYCYPNDLLRSHMDTLARAYEYLVVDNEAGLEHLSRRVAQDMDLTLIVSDATARGLRTARRVRELVEGLELDPGRLWLVINRLAGDPGPLAAEIDATGLELAGMVPQDDMVADYDLRGKPLAGLPASSPAVRAIAEIAARVGLT